MLAFLQQQPSWFSSSLTTLNASDLILEPPDAGLSTLPAVSGANLTNLPSDTPADTDVQITYDVSSNGSSAYRFTGPGYSGADNGPDLYLVKDKDIALSTKLVAVIHCVFNLIPQELHILMVFLVHRVELQDFNVQHDAPTRLYYQCTVHSGMIGNIYIVGGSDWRMTDVATNAIPEISLISMLE